MTKGRLPPKLSPEDRTLWRRVTDTVSPLRPQEPVREDVDGKPEKQKALGKPRREEQRHGKIEPPGPKPLPRTPRLAPLDSRLVRRLGRGAMAAEAVLDLHGLTQAEAHDRLVAFLVHSHSVGRRVVLVVTGKGRKQEPKDWWEEGGRGILRRAVPQWLATPEVRRLIVGYVQAHDRKGGEGAIYVQLRRNRGAGA